MSAKLRTQRDRVLARLERVTERHPEHFRRGMLRYYLRDAAERGEESPQGDADLAALAKLPVAAVRRERDQVERVRQRVEGLRAARDN